MTQNAIPSACPLVLCAQANRDAADCGGDSVSSNGVSGSAAAEASAVAPLDASSSGGGDGGSTENRRGLLQQ